MLAIDKHLRLFSFYPIFSCCSYSFYVLFTHGYISFLKPGCLTQENRIHTSYWKMENWPFSVCSFYPLGSCDWARKNTKTFVHWCFSTCLHSWAHEEILRLVNYCNSKVYLSVSLSESACKTLDPVANPFLYTQRLARALWPPIP